MTASTLRTVTLALMVDLSSNNSSIDLNKLRGDGYRVLCLKVTENTDYAWAASHQLAAEWHAFGAGFVVWHYHFLHPGDGAAQADWFYSHVKGDLRAGDRVVCDIETAGETGAEVSAFWARYISHDPRTPRVDYGSPYFLRDNHIRPAHGEALWLADYDTHIAFIPPGWTSYLAWQFTDAATVPGVGGRCDESHLTPGAMPPSTRPKIVPNPHPTPDYRRRPINCSTRPPVASGEPVQWGQWALAIRDDGVVGNQTRTALAHWQHIHGLTQDLVIGANTGPTLASVHR